MAVIYYAKGSNEKIAEHFRAKEFDCPCKRCNQTPIDVDFVRNVLEPIRVKIGEPLYVNAYRCQEHNAEVANASRTSLHMEGRAFDCSARKSGALVIAKEAEKLGVRGIGYYEKDNFTHLDSRTTKAFWLGHEQAPWDTFINDADRKHLAFIEELEALIKKYK